MTRSEQRIKQLEAGVEAIAISSTDSKTVEMAIDLLHTDSEPETVPTEAAKYEKAMQEDIREISGVNAVNSESETVEERAQCEKAYWEWIHSLPRCIDDCDGDLPGEPHELKCPMFGKDFATNEDTYRAGWQARAALASSLQDKSLDKSSDKSEVSCNPDNDLRWTNGETIRERAQQFLIKRFKTKAGGGFGMSREIRWSDKE